MSLSIPLGVTIKGNIASSNFGKVYQFKNDYISRKKNQTLKPNWPFENTQRATQPPSSPVTGFSWTPAWKPSLTLSLEWRCCPSAFLTAADGTLGGSRTGSSHGGYTLQSAGVCSLALTQHKSPDRTSLCFPFYKWQQEYSARLSELSILKALGRVRQLNKEYTGEGPERFTSQ